MSPRHIGLLGALSAIWGGSYLLIKYALEDLSAPMVVWTRVVIGAVVLYALIRVTMGAGAMRSKGFAHRELTLTWTVLVHDLWILARLQLKAARQAERKAA